MIHVSQVPTYFFRLSILAVVTTPTLMAQDPPWFEKNKLVPATQQSAPAPLWFNAQDVKSEFAAPQSTGRFWFQSPPDKTVTKAMPTTSADINARWTSLSTATTPAAPLRKIPPVAQAINEPKIAPAPEALEVQVTPEDELISAQHALAAQNAEPATMDAAERIAGPDSVPSTWIRSAVLAHRASSKKESSGTSVVGQKTPARANNKQVLESTLTDIKLSSLTLKSGQVELAHRPLDLKPTPLAIVTLQPPKLDGADLIRQLVADKNDQGLVVNVEFIDIAEQTDSNINSANARADRRGNSGPNDL